MKLTFKSRKESHNILWLKNGVAILVEHISKSDGPATPSQVNAIKVTSFKRDLAIRFLGLDV